MKTKGLLFSIMLIFIMSIGAGCLYEEVILKINVPTETLSAELGSYDIPEYQVADETGLIMAGYTVTCEKVTDPNGNDVKIVLNKINAITPGIYQFTYYAGENIDKAVLKVEFADTTPPTVEMKDDELPQYYICGFDYSLPVYSITNGADLSKCYVKVFYQAENSQERTEVEVTDNNFKVEHNSGDYIIVIHAEDSSQNSKDYEYFVEATGPSEIIPGKILYFDESFGVSQVSTLWNGFDFAFTNEKFYGDEKGSVKVVNKIETDYVILDKLLEKDVSKYTHLVVRVYNDNDFDAYTGYCWFGDTTLKAKEWSELKIPVSALDKENIAHPAISGINISSQDITNLTLRLFADPLTNKLPLGSVFYISSMYAITEVPLKPENPVENQITYFGEEFGSEQVKLHWNDVYKLEFSKEQCFNDEAGSLKVTFNKVQDNYIVVDNPYIKDISAYDYIVFRVYNPTDKEFTIGTTWAGDTQIKAKAWTEVKFNVSLFDEGKIKTMGDQVIAKTDITGLPIRVFNAGGLAIGDSFYISNIWGEKTVPVENENIVLNSENINCLERVNALWAEPHELSFDETIKYENEKGSLKVTVKKAQDNYIILNNPCKKDISVYDYIVFRVYNPTDKEFTIGTTWAGDTQIKAKAWTEVKFNVSLFDEGKIKTMGDQVIAKTDITGLPIRVFNAGGLAIGDSFYISNIFGGKL